MGLIRDWLKNMGEVWEAAEKGDVKRALEPWRFKGTGSGGTGPGGTGSGGPGGTGSGGSGGTGSGFTARQIELLEDLFYQQHGRYPNTPHEFEVWIRHNL